MRIVTKNQRLAWYILSLQEVEKYGKGSCTCMRLEESDTEFKEMLQELREEGGKDRYSDSHILLPELHALRTSSPGRSSWFITHEERVAALKKCIGSLEKEVKIERAMIEFEKEEEIKMQAVLITACMVLVTVLALMVLNIG